MKIADVRPELLVYRCCGTDNETGRHRPNSSVPIPEFVFMNFNQSKTHDNCCRYRIGM
ncbi:hypothetical protein HanRHA438_Chr06g0269561 [Helianthus annuus]|nr:hypothetical protein HanRHA438_Chr06g0269561 [Helianthus annuus]